MHNWTYHFFNLIELGDVQLAFPKWDPQFAAEAYSNWLSTWIRNAELLYRSQLIGHQEATWNQFCRKNNWSSDRYLDNIERQELEEFQMKNGFAEHEQAYDSQTKVLDHLQKATCNKGFERLNFTGIAGIFDNYDDYLASVQKLRPNSQSVELAIMRIWFNLQIQNSVSTQNALRRMPYSDYLNTSHWKFVRSAMLLAHRARCQGQECCGSDAYWLDESFLHVHHMTYQNLGNERFEDLHLLCKECHDRYHAQDNSVLYEDDTDLYQTIVQMQNS